jgi:hypothetical protein
MRSALSGQNWGTAEPSVCPDLMTSTFAKKLGDL